MWSKTHISVRKVGDVAIIDVTGSLTEGSEREMDIAYQQVQIEELNKILINFDQQCFITSDGFGLIVKLIWQTRNTGRVLRVVHSSDQTRELFDVIGLTQSIDVFDSEEAALAEF